MLTLYSGYAQQQYTNPILTGFYPDPSICKAGNSYYLINSTFAYFPGIPIFKSDDLVNWQLIGHVLDRPEQLPLEGMGVSRAIFAPSIRYHKGVFYVVCTLIDGKGNFVATATNPAGPWSNPVWLPEVNGIDPSLFFDTDDKAYIVYNSIPPDNVSLYSGHRTIRIRTFDYQQLKVGSKETILVNGGTDISKKPSWIEGPHLIRTDNGYVLIAAQGGTGFNHSEVAFRSKQIEGPYVPNPIPILTQVQDTSAYPITSTGHADLVETSKGKWQAVFLGTRPYQGDFYNTGRDTYLAPVTWKDGWPWINPGKDKVLYHYALPLPVSKSKTQPRYSGNFTVKDDFSNSALHKDWIFLRTPRYTWHTLNERKGWLGVQLRSTTAGGKMNPSMIVRRQQHLQFTATTAVDCTPATEQEKAGIIAFQNETHFYYLCKAVVNNQPVIQLCRSVKDSLQMEVLQTQPLQHKGTVHLRIEGKGSQYAFAYSTDGKQWTYLSQKEDGYFLSTQKAGGFVGTTLGVYATAMGQSSTNMAWFDYFTYTGNDAQLQ